MKLIKKLSAIGLSSALIFSSIPSFEAKAAVLGDVNNDGKLTAEDATMVLIDFANIIAQNGSKLDLSVADVTKDGKITAEDATAILIQYATNLVNEAAGSQGGTDLGGGEKKGEIHHGNATFYGGGYKGGAALLDGFCDPYYITAMNRPDWDTALLAGAYIRVFGERGSLDVLVADELPEGSKGDLDLHTTAFPKIADPVKGRVAVSWKIIPFPGAENKPLQYKYKDGSSKYWVGVQVRNHRYPVKKFEYLDKSGKYVSVPKKNYNYFVVEGGMGEGPFTFRITDIYGDVVVDKNIRFDVNNVVDGKVQFPK